MSLHLQRSANWGGLWPIVGWLVGCIFGMRQASSRWSFSGKEALTKVCEVIYEHRTLGSIGATLLVCTWTWTTPKGCKKWGTLKVVVQFAI